MESDDSDLSADILLGLAKYIIELMNPSHRLATCNLEEIISALKHDFKSKRVRLKCVPVPQEVIKSLFSSSTSGAMSPENEIYAVVGLRAAIALGIPVGGTCLGLLSKCICPVASVKECAPRCQAIRQSPKAYTLQIASNRRVSPYQILVNETLHHNVETHLFGSPPHFEKSSVVQVRRCDHVVGGGRFTLNFASRVIVSWIEQPIAVDESVFSASLSGYFEVPRHLHKGDIFKIQISQHAPEILFSPGKFALQDLYFVIKSIEGPGYENIRNPSENIGFLVQKGETMLVQDSNVHSYLPCVSLSGYSKLNMLLPNYPQGLKKVFEKLVNASIPFLRGSLPGLQPAFLLTGPMGCGKRSVASSVAAHLGMNIWTVDCIEIRGGTPGQSVGKLKAVFSKAKQYAPCIFLLSNIHVLSRDQDGHEDCRVLDEFRDQLSNLKASKFPVVLLGTTESATAINAAFARAFLLEVPIMALEKEERRLQLIQCIAQQNVRVNEECIHEVAARCSGFLLGDLVELVALAIRDTLCKKQQSDQLHQEDKEHRILIDIENFGNALDQMQSAYAGSIGAPKIPSVKWNDIGGLEDIKKEILQTVTLPLKHPELTARGLRRSGVLLYGPPGTGKTLLAKAVATECNLNFLSVKGPELLNMYVGQSEANVREIFERAREASPCIIFFDELDALAPNRGRSGDSGGVMDRVVSQLLSEMDGMNKSSLLFVIGATNRPDLIDPALLRPGRFDKLLYVGAYEDSDSKYSVLSALTRKFKLSQDVDLEEISKKLPHEVTGADMYAVCSGAWLGAVRRLIKQNEGDIQKYPAEVEVSQKDFNLSVSKMVPSVSAEDMRYFKGLQQQMSAIPAK